MFDGLLMTTHKVQAEVDIEELTRLAKVSEETWHGVREPTWYRGRRALSVDGADRQFIAAASPTTVLALLQELAELRAKQGGGWKPFWFDNDSTPILEGRSYLFAAGSAATGWSYFHDALVWDAESYAQWREGDHGFATEDVKFYWELPSPVEQADG